MNRVIVSSAFDNIQAEDLRFLQEASKLGEVHVLLWSDEAVTTLTGKAPKFPYAERLYFVQAARYVKEVHPGGGDLDACTLPTLGFKPDLWAIQEGTNTAARNAFCQTSGIVHHIIANSAIADFPAPPAQAPTGRKKVVVTGCYDWFHTGHVAFFEEVSALGDLHVCLGNDENLCILKGPGHPLFKAPHRLFIAGSIRYVAQALVSTGSGWMDAENEILNVIKPDMYAVNEDGDKPEKAEFCRQHGIQYVVLKRVPKKGLVKRSSTDLRGF